VGERFPSFRPLRSRRWVFKGPQFAPATGAFPNFSRSDPSGEGGSEHRHVWVPTEEEPLFDWHEQAFSLNEQKER